MDQLICTSRLVRHTFRAACACRGQRRTSRCRCCRHIAGSGDRDRGCGEAPTPSPSVLILPTFAFQTSLTGEIVGVYAFRSEVHEHALAVGDGCRSRRSWTRLCRLSYIGPSYGDLFPHDSWPLRASSAITLSVLLRSTPTLSGCRNGLPPSMCSGRHVPRDDVAFDGRGHEHAVAPDDRAPSVHARRWQPSRRRCGRATIRPGSRVSIRDPLSVRPRHCGQLAAPTLTAALRDDNRRQ